MKTSLPVWTPQSKNGNNPCSPTTGSTSTGIIWMRSLFQSFPMKATEWGNWCRTRARYVTFAPTSATPAAKHFWNVPSISHAPGRGSIPRVCWMMWGNPIVAVRTGSSSSAGNAYIRKINCPSCWGASEEAYSGFASSSRDSVSLVSRGESQHRWERGLTSQLCLKNRIRLNHTIARRRKRRLTIRDFITWHFQRRKRL